MTKYRCKICGNQVELTDIDDDYICPKCNLTHTYVEEENDVSKSIPIDTKNVSIQRIIEKCINCGMCSKVCPVSTEIKNGNLDACIGCGMCIKKCPVAALVPKYDYNDVLNEIRNSKKTVVVITSPAVKVSIGDGFGFDYGTNIEKKLVTALKVIGFDYVFDTTFGADLTIMEEANELVKRFNSKDKLPMFTSCCPAWVKYLEMKYPEYIPNLSTCKSPIAMQSTILKTYFCKIKNIKPEDLVVVSLTPCTAKKQEIKRKEFNNDTDYVITASEVINMFHENNIKLNEMKESSYDDMFYGTGAGVIFGKTGGVMISAIRYAYNILTNENLDINKINFEILDGYDGIKKANIKIKDKILKIAVVSGINEVDKLISELKNKTLDLDFIEVMACIGGCVAGGGQPLIPLNKEKDIIVSRINGLKDIDKNMEERVCYKNKSIIKLYNEFLGLPLSDKAHELLHTSFKDKSDVIKG